MIEASYQAASSGQQQVSDIAERSGQSLAFTPRFGRYTLQGLNTDVVTLPFSYSINQSPVQTWVLDAPITLVKTEDTLAGSGSLGVGYRYSVQDGWTVMPQLRVGLTASDDLGAAAMIYGAGLVSNYRLYDFQSSQLSTINLVSLYKTTSIKVADFSSAYDLINVVSRQGVQYDHPIDIYFKGQPFIVQAQASRTDFFGDDVYSKYSHDLSLSIGAKNPSAKGLIKEYRAGLTYMTADKGIRGVQINAGYTF